LIVVESFDASSRGPPVRRYYSGSDFGSNTIGTRAGRRPVEASGCCASKTNLKRRFLLLSALSYRAAGRVSRLRTRQRRPKPLSRAESVGGAGRRPSGRRSNDRDANCDAPKRRSGFDPALTVNSRLDSSTRAVVAGFQTSVWRYRTAHGELQAPEGDRRGFKWQLFISSVFCAC
jgi:hypothetical protein